MPEINFKNLIPEEVKLYSNNPEDELPEEPSLIKTPPKEKHPPVISPDDLDEVIIPPSKHKIPDKDLPIGEREGNA